MRRIHSFALILLFLMPVRLIAQSVRVSGMVQDQSGAAIPSAPVTLRKGAETRTTLTNINGSFSFDQVGTGTYEVEAAQPGFKTAAARVVVGTRNPRAIEFKLQIVDLQQELTVAGDDIEVSTQTENNLDVAALDRNALDNAPIFDQNYIATISRFLDSGAAGTAGTALIMDGLVRRTRSESLDQYRRNQNVGGVNLAQVATNFRNREDIFVYNQTTTFTPKLINDFRILLGKEYQPTRSVQAGPKIVVLDAFTGGDAQADRLQTEYHTVFHDALSWSHGKHTLRMGIDVPDLSRRGLEDSTNFQGTFTFSSLQDYLDNRPFSFIQQAGRGKVIFWEKVLGGFILDDIRVRPNLTISVAARYDWQNYFHDINNVSPRIAFAFSPAHHSKTVIRGGAGVFYDRSGPQPISDLLRYDGRRLLQYVVTNPGFPNPWAQWNSAGGAKQHGSACPGCAHSIYDAIQYRRGTAVAKFDDAQHQLYRQRRRQHLSLAGYQCALAAVLCDAARPELFRGSPD